MYLLPVVLLANIGNGIVLNLSFWYKQTGKTKFAIVVTGSGLVCTVLFNLLLIPRLGYLGAAWARLGCGGIMVLISYILNRIYFPTPYNIRHMSFYLMVGALLYIIGMWHKNLSDIASFLIKMSLIAIFILLVVKTEKIDVGRRIKTLLGLRH